MTDTLPLMPPKVVLVTPYFPPAIGGLELYAHQIARRMDERGAARVVVITANHQGNRYVEDVVDGIHVYRLPCLLTVYRTPVHPLWYWQIRRILAREEPDLVNVHLPVPYIGDLAAMAARRLPLVVTYHSGSMRKGKPFADAIIFAYEHLGRRLTMHLADHIVTSSEWIRHVTALGFLEKTTVITPGVDLARFTPGRGEVALRPEFVFVGNTSTPQLKGLDILIGAARLLPDVTITIVGEPTDDTAPNVQYVGPKTGPALVEIMRRARAIVVPSRSEGFGMVAIEAMACGRAVVASAVGGLASVVKDGETGLVVPPADVLALKNALRRLADCPALAEELGAAGRAIAERSYDWDATTSRTLAVYDDAIRAHARPRAADRPLLRVAIVCEEYPPYVNGGLGVHYGAMVDALSEFCEVHMIAASVDRHTPIEETHGRIHIHRLRVPRMFPLNHLMFEWKAMLRVARMQMDVLDVCSPFGLLAALLARAPVVVKVHTTYANARGGAFYNLVFFPLASMIDRLLLARSALTVTTSEFMRHELITAYGAAPEKVQVIANGVLDEPQCTEWDTAALYERFHIPPSARIVLYVGRFVPRKNVLALVRAAPGLIAKCPDTHIVLLGGGFTEGLGYETQMRQEIAALGVTERVILASWVPHEGTGEFYQAAHILVHPATYEPFGLGVLEAMRAGLPVVVVGGAGGPAEIVGDAGVVLTSGEPEAIVDAVGPLLGDLQECARLGAIARQRSRAFSWRDCALKTVGLYRQAVACSKVATAHRRRRPEES